MPRNIQQPVARRMPNHTPTEITLHQKSRTLGIRFSDGKHFRLPSEYLRVHSKAADQRTLQEPITGKEHVNIVKIEPQGQYGVQLFFDDGHDTGIYSFDTLYELGERQEQNWAAYLQRLQESGQSRQESTSDSGRNLTVTALPFAWLARLLESDEETVELSAGSQTVADLLARLRRKPGRWSELLQDDQLDIEIDEQTVSLYTVLKDRDEVVIIPKSPVAPQNSRRLG